MEILLQPVPAAPRHGPEPKTDAGGALAQAPSPSAVARPALAEEAYVVAVSDATMRLLAQDQSQPREWRFTRQEETQEMLFQIVDSSDGSVILQIPDEASVRRRVVYATAERDRASGAFSTRA